MSDGWIDVPQDVPAGTLPHPRIPDYDGFRKLAGIVISPDETDRLKNELGWGTHGKSGKEPLQYVRLRDCETEHLRMIVITQPRIPPLYRHIILLILEDRWRKEATNATGR
jgi:hypothetical protein